MNKTLWEGDIEGPCVFSWKVNLSAESNPTAALFSFFIDGV